MGVAVNTVPLPPSAPAKGLSPNYYSPTFRVFLPFGLPGPRGTKAARSEDLITQSRPSLWAGRRPARHSCSTRIAVTPRCWATTSVVSKKFFMPILY